MKLLIAGLPLILVACGSTQFSLGRETRAAKSDECCASDCDVTVQCLPNGNCLISCTNEAGATCEVELSCAGGQCTVVRSDCPPTGCCTAQTEAQQH